MEQSSAGRPSSTALLQRVRNSIIEYLDVASSFENQREYQAAAPDISVPNEVINQWEDWISPNWKSELIGPVFSSQERAGIERFGQVLASVAATTTDSLPSLEQLVITEPWKLLQTEARNLAAIFAIRGKL